MAPPARRMLILRRRAMLAITSAKRRVRNLADETASRRRLQPVWLGQSTAIRVASL
jgi:hypothetical protein